MTIQVSSVVALKSVGQEMTVIGLDDELNGQPYELCEWKDASGIKK